MSGPNVIRSWVLGIGAFTVPVALLFGYIWLTRSVASMNQVWRRGWWVMDLGALGLSIAVGAVLAWLTTKGTGRVALVGAYAAAVFAALRANLFCKICVWLHGQCP